MSFFRSPDASNSYADETPLSTDYSENRQTESHPIYPLSRVETFDSGHAASELNLIQDPRRRQDLFAHSLLEDRCTLEALTELQKNGQAYDKDHPQVKALASHKYAYICDWLRRNKVIASGPERPEFGQIRHAFRQGVDYLFNQTPNLESPPLFPRHGSPTALALRRDINAVPSSRSSTPTRPEDVSRMFHNLSLRSSLPEFMQLLFEHPMLDSSRYTKSFAEIGVLGKGGYGKVYRVRNILDRSEYAVKKVILSSSRIERIKRRGQAELDALFAEVVTLARLDHPNIVRYYSGWLEHHTLESLTGLAQRTSSRRLKLLEGPSMSEKSHATDGLSEIFDRNQQLDTDDHFPSGGSQIVFESSASASRAEKHSCSEHKQSCIPRQPSPRLALKPLPLPVMTPLKNGAGQNTEETDLQKESVESGQGDSEAIGGKTSIWTSSESTTDPSEPRLILHVQMALYPLSLADYLMEPSSRGSVGLFRNIQHCFHLDMSSRILLEILDGVEYLHKMGIVHRDLKPSNIFLSIQDQTSHKHLDIGTCTDCNHDSSSSGPYLNLRIGDFGLVAEIARPKSHNSPFASEAVGTELYRPPCLEAIHEKLDVYAMGVIAFELLSPFDTSLSLLSQWFWCILTTVVGMERYETIQLLRKGIPPENFLSSYGQAGKQMAKIVKSMVDSEPHKRPACSEIRASLSDLME